MPELHISRIIFVCEVYTYESYACPFQNHNWTVLFCIHKFNHLYYKSIPYVLALHLIGICLDSKHCHYTYMNLFINIKILKSELSWCCRNRILPVDRIIKLIYYSIKYLFTLTPLKELVQWVTKFYAGPCFLTNGLHFCYWQYFKSQARF